jgi:hypothetical protein
LHLLRGRANGGHRRGSRQDGIDAIVKSQPLAPVKDQGKARNITQEHLSISRQFDADSLSHAGRRRQFR